MRNTTFVWFSLLSITILGACSGICYYFCTAHKITVTEGAYCPSRQGYPRSICTRAKYCTTRDANNNLSDTIEGCGFSTPNGEELICCPHHLPSMANSNSIQTVEKLDEEYYNYLGSLGYLEPIYMDDYEYRYTVIVLSPSHILATIQSVNQPNKVNPVRVLLGTSNPTQYADTNVDLGVRLHPHIKNDLALFTLEKPINEDQLRTNVSIAKLCHSDDLLNSPKMYAIGFARNRRNGISCSTFRQQVHAVDINKCRNVQNTLNVKDLDKPNAHLCVIPGADYSTGLDSQDTPCLRCLTASSSVLHVERRDGSYCVGGIATPTTDDCFVNGEPLYYTILLESTFQSL